MVTSNKELEKAIRNLMNEIDDYAKVATIVTNALNNAEKAKEQENKEKEAKRIAAFNEQKKKDEHSRQRQKYINYLRQSTPSITSGSMYINIPFAKNVIMLALDNDARIGHNWDAEDMRFVEGMIDILLNAIAEIPTLVKDNGEVDFIKLLSGVDKVMDYIEKSIDSDTPKKEEFDADKIMEDWKKKLDKLAIGF